MDGAKGQNGVLPVATNLDVDRRDQLPPKKQAAKLHNDIRLEATSPDRRDYGMCVHTPPKKQAARAQNNVPLEATSPDKRERIPPKKQAARTHKDVIPEARSPDTGEPFPAKKQAFKARIISSPTPRTATVPTSPDPTESDAFPSKHQSPDEGHVLDLVDWLHSCHRRGIFYGGPAIYGLKKRDFCMGVRMPCIERQRKSKCPVLATLRLRRSTGLWSVTCSGKHNHAPLKQDQKSRRLKDVLKDLRKATREGQLIAACGKPGNQVAILPRPRPRPIPIVIRAPPLQLVFFPNVLVTNPTTSSI